MNNLITRIDDMDRLFHQLWSAGPATASSDSSDMVLRPRADVYESDEKFVVELDLPGVVKDDLQVDLERNVLTIEATRKSEESDDLQGVHVERSTNARLARRFTLSKEIDADRIEARFENGVLRLTLPKAEKALPRRISIQ